MWNSDRIRFLYDRLNSSNVVVRVFERLPYFSIRNSQIRYSHVLVTFSRFLSLRPGMNTAFRTVKRNTIFPSLLLSILVLVTISRTTVPLSASAANQFSSTNLSTIASQGLVVDIYSDQGGQGANMTIGTYVIGDVVKFYIYISKNSTIQERIITPNGTAWLRMSGPVNSGTIIDYFDTQYPTGRWAISVTAQIANETASDVAPFEVVDKQPYTCTKTSLFNTSGSPGETKFTGRVVRTYLYPVGGIHTWDVQVDHVYYGPDIRNQTVQVQILTATFTLGHPPGSLDENMTLGDEIAVYGLLTHTCTCMSGQSVSLNGSVNYYAEKLSTLCEHTQPQTTGTGSKVTSSNWVELEIGALAIIIALLALSIIALRNKHPSNPSLR